MWHPISAVKGEWLDGVNAGNDPDAAYRLISIDVIDIQFFDAFTKNFSLGACKTAVMLWGLRWSSSLNSTAKFCASMTSDA